MLIHSPPQTCVLASPNAANGCAVLIDLLPLMGVLINLLASMPRVHCHSFGLMPRDHCHFQLASMPRVHCHFQLASMPQVHCRFNWLQCRGFIAISIGFNAAGSLPLSIGFNATGSLPFIWLNATGSLPLSIGFIALSWVHCLSHRDTPLPHLPFGAPFCLLVPHLPFGAHICLFGFPLIVAFCCQGR